MEPKLDQGPPKKHSENMTEKDTEKGAKLGPKMGRRNLTSGMRGAPGEFKLREFEQFSERNPHTRPTLRVAADSSALRIPQGRAVDAVLFESCVGEVAVAMTFASIFHLEFWFLWGVVLGAFFSVFLGLCGS